MIDMKVLDARDCRLMLDAINAKIKRNYNLTPEDRIDLATIREALEDILDQAEDSDDIGIGIL